MRHKQVESMDVIHAIKGYFRKFKWNKPSPYSNEEQAILNVWCLTVVREGHLKRILEQLVEESESRQLNCSTRLVWTTPAELEWNTRNGIGKVWDKICVLANQADKKPDNFDAYSVI